MSGSSAKQHTILGSTQNCCIQQHINNTNKTNILGNGSANYFWSGSEFIACDAGNDERSRVSHHGLESSCTSSAYHGIGRFSFHEQMKLTSGDDDVQYENNNNKTDSDDKVFGENPKRTSEQMEQDLQDLCRPQKKAKSNVTGGVAGDEEGELDLLVGDLKLGKGAFAAIKGELSQATRIIRCLNDQVDILKDKVDSKLEQIDDIKREVDTLEEQLNIEKDFSVSLSVAHQAEEKSAKEEMAHEVRRLEREKQLEVETLTASYKSRIATLESQYEKARKSRRHHLLSSLSLDDYAAGGIHYQKQQLLRQLDQAKARIQELEDIAGAPPAPPLLAAVPPPPQGAAEAPPQLGTTSSMTVGTILASLGPNMADSLERVIHFISGTTPPFLTTFNTYLNELDNGQNRSAPILHLTVVQGAHFLDIDNEGSLLTNGSPSLHQRQKKDYSFNVLFHFRKIIKEEFRRTCGGNWSWERVCEEGGWSNEILMMFLAHHQPILDALGLEWGMLMNGDHLSRFKFEFCHGVSFEDYDSPLHKMSPGHCFMWFRKVNDWQDNRQLYSLNPITRTIHGKTYGTFEVAPTNATATVGQRNANTRALFVQSSVATVIDLLVTMQSTSSDVNRPERTFAQFKRTSSSQRNEGTGGNDGQVCVGTLTVKLITTPFHKKPKDGARVFIEKTAKVENGLVVLDQHNRECALVNPAISSQLLNFLGNETLIGKVSFDNAQQSFLAVCKIFSPPGNIASTDEQMSAIAGRVQYAPRGYGNTISTVFNSTKVAELVADQETRNPMDKLIAQVANERAQAIGGSIQYNDPTLLHMTGKCTGNEPNNDVWKNNADLAQSLIDTHSLLERFVKPKDFDDERFTEQFWKWTKEQRKKTVQDRYKKDRTTYESRIDWLKRVRWWRDAPNCNINKNRSKTL